MNKVFISSFFSFLASTKNVMIFGGGHILFIFCALIFALQVPTSNAYYLNNNGYDVALKDDGGCFGCVGYKCKLNDGKIIEGKDCLKNAIKFCGISKSDVSMLNSVVQEKVYEYKSETYFIFSCQDDKDVNDAMGEEEDYMDVKMDQWRKKRDDIKDRMCLSIFLSKPSETADVSTKREYIEHGTKCILLICYRNSIEGFGEAENALNNVKMAAEELLKIIDDANTTANGIKKFGHYYKKEIERIAQKAENVSTGLTEVDKMLKTLNERYSMFQKKCNYIKETKLGCSNETLNCKIAPFHDAVLEVLDTETDARNQATEYLKKAKELTVLTVLITEIKPPAEKVFTEANVALTAQNAQELSKDAKEIGIKAKKEAKESKEIGENSNKTANFAIEIGIEAKMAANESMKIGNEANQKVLEVEKLAKDSLKLAETNQKEGDKTEEEVLKLKSNGKTNGWKIGIFGISLFAFILLYWF